MNKTYASSKQILLPLQGLRALAFISIFLSHTNVRVFAYSGLGVWGVSVFLILSGFLMMVNYYQSDRITDCSMKGNFKFSIRKLSKFYPLHIVMMLSAIPFEIKTIVTDSGEGLLHSWIALLSKVLLNITVTQSFVPYSDIYYSLNAVSWYLSVCLLTYFCFPWILRYFEGHMSLRKAKLLMPVLLVLQIVLCWLSSKVNITVSDGFTKWFTYNFPVMRMIDFLFGCLLGYVYLRQRDNNGQSNNIPGILNHKNAVDAALIINLVIIIAALVVYSVANPADNPLSHPELWWRYSCLFTLLNGFLIYLLAADCGIICRILSAKGILFIGGISSTAFLIHQMIIRYTNVLWDHMSVSNSLLKLICSIFIPFVLTIAACMIWNRISHGRSKNAA